MAKLAAVLTRRAFASAAAAALGGVVTGCGRERDGASLWFSYGGRNRATLERLIQRFNDEDHGARIHGVFQGDYYEGLAKLRLGIAAGAGPSFSHVIGEVIPYLHEAGVLEPLDGYPGAGDVELVPELGQAGSWRGGASRPLVALPFNRSTPIAYLNGDLFDELGLSAPKTWEELRSTARALTLSSGGRTRRFGFSCPTTWWFWVALLEQAGGEVVEPDGTVSLGGGAGEAAIRFWQTLIHRDRTMKPPAGRDANANESTNNMFLAGRVAMIWTSTAFLKYFEDNAPFRVVAAPLPAGRRKAMATGGTHFVLLRDEAPEHKRAAWAFVRWMLEPRQVIEWATSTGYMPVTRAAIRTLEQRGYYERNPNDRVAVDQLADALPWPWSPDLFRIQREVVTPRLERAVLADADASAVMADARRAAAR